MTVDRLIRHFSAREYMELCGEKTDRGVRVTHAAQKHTHLHTLCSRCEVVWALEAQLRRRNLLLAARRRQELTFTQQTFYVF